jgi:hypothetical protein
VHGYRGYARQGYREPDDGEPSPTGTPEAFDPYTYNHRCSLRIPAPYKDTRLKRSTDELGYIHFNNNIKEYDDDEDAALDIKESEELELPTWEPFEVTEIPAWTGYTSSKWPT